jgi:hypothetical protein
MAEKKTVTPKSPGTTTSKADKGKAEERKSATLRARKSATVKHASVRHH